MEGGEQVLPSATTVAAAGYPNVSPPPLADPVGASDLAAAASDDVVAEPEIHALISDEEHDHDHDHDHDHEHEHEHDHDLEHDHEHEHDHHEDRDDHAAVAAVEYYFSDENLPTDKYLLGFVKRNKEGFVPVSVIASFRKIKKLTRDHAFIVAALKESSLLV
ncbi:La-related protein 6A [Glycine max]|nr:La-related protein 6A [Glycine max]